MNENQDTQGKLPVNLAPIPISDCATLARFWERIENSAPGGPSEEDFALFEELVEALATGRQVPTPKPDSKPEPVRKRSFLPGIITTDDKNGDGFCKMFFRGIPETSLALRMLDDERFKKLIHVDALAFPTLACSDQVRKESKWYEEHLWVKGTREEFIPLAEKRIGYGDPWRDGKFPDEARFNGKEQLILPETCVWVDCPECHGEGSCWETKRVKTGKSEKCPRCLGSGLEHGETCSKCAGDGWVYAYETKKVKCSCAKCHGYGKLKSVLEAHHTRRTETRIAFHHSVPKDTIPKFIREALSKNTDCSSAIDYKVLSELGSSNGRFIISDKDIPVVGAFEEDLRERLDVLQNAVEDKKAQIRKETIKFASCLRYVRFHIVFYVGITDMKSVSEVRAKGYIWDPKHYEVLDGFIDNLIAGKVENGYFKRPHGEQVETYIWVDTATRCAWVGRPTWLSDKNSCCYWGRKNVRQFNDYEYYSPDVGLTAILVAMGKAANGGKCLPAPWRGSEKQEKNSPPKQTPKTPRQTPQQPAAQKQKAVNGNMNVRQKKRWKFVLLGLLFGWMGAHLMYAKRTFLQLLLWASFIVGVVMCGMSQNASDAQGTQQEASAKVAKERNNYEAIGGGCMALWLLLWLGGTLFIKKDGKGNRM